MARVTCMIRVADLGAGHAHPAETLDLTARREHTDRKDDEPQQSGCLAVAARYWLFEPARLNGRPVAASATLVLEFRLH